MLNAVKRQRPYPVSIALGDSDLDTVLDAAVAFEQQAATIAERDARIEALKGALKVSADAIDETLDKDFGFWSSAARGARRAVMWGARVIARATLER
jgi:hypothetical protein